MHIENNTKVVVRMIEATAKIFTAKINRSIYYPELFYFTHGNNEDSISFPVIYFTENVFKQALVLFRVYNR